MKILDLETDNLFPELTKIHCAVTYDTATGDTRTFEPHQIQEKEKQNGRVQHQKSCAYLTGARLVIFRVLVTLPDLLSRCRPYFQEVRCDEKEV